MNEKEMSPFGRELTADEWIELGKICAEHGMLYLLLTGGEPFSRPDFRRIYSSMRKLGLCVSINTNAALIKDDDIEFLKRECPESVNITLYGASDETYKRLCGVDNAFEKVIKNIDALKKNNIPVRLNVSLTRDNINDLEEIVRIGKSRDIPLKITSYMFRPVRKTDGKGENNNVVFSEEESGYSRFLTMKYLLDEDLFRRIRNSFRENNFTVGFHGDCDETGDDMSCMAGKSSFWITWNGKMLPCGMINEPCANLIEAGFSASWRYITDEISKVRLPAECKNCKAKNICRPCGAITLSESGDFSKKPEYLCESTKAYIRNMISDKN